MMTNEERALIIEKRLQKAFKPQFIQVIDDSDAHLGHAGAQGGAGHFEVIIDKAVFTGQSRLKAHQAIYGELKDLIPHEIHALAIKLS